MNNARLTTFFYLAAFACAAFASPTMADPPLTDLRAFYLDEDAIRTNTTSARPWSELRPYVRITGGGVEPSARVGSNGQLTAPVGPYTALDLPLTYVLNSQTSGELVLFNGYREAVCDSELRVAPPFLVGKKTVRDPNIWYSDLSLGTPNYYSLWSSGCYAPVFTTPPGWPRRLTRDETTISAPVRRTAIDGGQYDASPFVVTRNGLPWYTYYFGYHLGVAAVESNWSAANLAAAGDIDGFFRLPSAANNFNLASLPPPWVEDEVVEYVNRANFPAQPDGQYFYAVRAIDKTVLDSMPVWERTGRSFKSGGYVSVCRFYGGKNGGPNTHFYSADDKECDALKKITFLDYEGQTFAVNMPLPGPVVNGDKPCPTDSKPLYRLYNNASSSNGKFVSNHRYTTSRVDVATFVARGWVDEGHVMCVPL
jgi:Repeat of unknown function (DUF5648)